MTPEPLKEKGRWANEDLYLEYAQEAINNTKLKEHCISLWFKDEDIKSAVEWLKEWKVRVCITLKAKCGCCKNLFTIYYTRKTETLCNKCLTNKAFEDVK